MRRCIACVTIVAALLMVQGQAGATPTISTLPMAGMTPPFGEGGFGDFWGVATIGQTITVPEGSSGILNQWVFFAEGWPTMFARDTVEFGAYVMEWAPDVNQATGDILWEGGPYATTDTTDPGGDDSEFEQFIFDTGELHLTPGGQYVLIVSASEYFDGEDGTAAPAAGKEPYEGGQFVMLNNGEDIGLWTTQPWDTTWSTFDLGFEATFQGPSPGAVLLTSVGAVLVAWLRRRKMLQ